MHGQRFLLVVFAVVTLVVGSLGSAPVASAAPSDPVTALQQFWQDSAGAPRSSSSSQSSQSSQWSQSSSINRQLLAKAQPDECFDGVGNPYPAMVDGKCPAGTTPKVNQAYVWGLAKAGNSVWFGTAANVHCLVLGGFLDQTTPDLTDSYVCEFGDSQSAKNNPGLPDSIGDWRPPHIYLYNTSSKRLTDKSSLAGSLLQKTTGLRSAGTFNNIVYLAGPSLTGGINVFAFDVRTGSSLGSKNLSQFDNIRKWIVAGNVLYTSVHNTAGGGSVLRWTGTRSSPFSFVTVGNLDADGAEIAYHKGRLYVSTWPEGSKVSGLWMSPAIGSRGLTAGSANSWTKVWTVAAYEPDPVTAATYGGGALVSFGDYLYWGTMHVPFVSTLAHAQIYPASVASQNDILATIAGTHRAIAIFRGKGFDTPHPTTEVLYGEAALPAYSPASGWQIVPTGMGAPLYGHSGFGNPFNNYTWSMAVYDGQLYIGTMDWSYIFSREAPRIVSMLSGGAPVDVSAITNLLPYKGYGADLMRIPNTRSRAVAVSTDGLGNYSNYGFRNLLADSTGLYVGTANPMNLMTSKSDGKPLGGWELLRITNHH